MSVELEAMPYKSGGTKRDEAKQDSDSNVRDRVSKNCQQRQNYGNELSFSSSEMLAFK